MWLIEDQAKRRAETFIAEHKKAQAKALEELKAVQKRTEKILTKVASYIKDAKDIKINQQRDMKDLLAFMQNMWDKTVYRAIYITMVLYY